MSKVDELIVQAERLEREGQNEMALATWRQAACEDAGFKGRLLLADACLRLGSSEEGERLIQSMIHEEPNDSDPYLVLGSYYLDVDRLQDARESLERAAERNASVPTLVLLGVAYGRLGDVARARTCYERALSLEPNFSEALYNLGVTYRFTDQGRATELFRRAVAADPEDGPAHRELGHMLWRAGDTEQAETHVRTALGLNSEDAWAHDYLGSLLILRSAPQEAQAEFERAIGLCPDLPLFHCHLGDALAQQGYWQQAEASYLNALALDTNYYLANLQYGRLLTERGQLSKARRYLERALQAKPTLSRARRALERLDVQLKEKQ